MSSDTGFYESLEALFDFETLSLVHYASGKSSWNQFDFCRLAIALCMAAQSFLESLINICLKSVLELS